MLERKDEACGYYVVIIIIVIQQECLLLVVRIKRSIYHYCQINNYRPRAQTD
jgi:hypothetical protein